METRQEPAQRKDGPATPPPPARPTAEATRAGVTVRVAVSGERHDEEEKEAGYGHGV